MALCSVAHPLLNVNICTAKPPKLSTSFSLRPIHPFLKCRQRAVSSMPRALLGEAGRRGYTSVLIVPTGVGAAIGGFAGDALPVARAMASVVDCLISHPNVLNAAMLYWPMPNALYVEGYALDRFAEGLWGLQAVHQNKVEKWVDAHTGQSTGRIGHPDSLLRAVDTLINCAGVNAVAVVGRFPDDNLDELEDYRQGKGVDILAGVEAIISHLVVKEFHIPCAHAPALLPLPLDSSLCPRSAAEEIGYTFLPSVLAGLSKAPQYVVKKEEYPGFVSRHGCLWADVVDSVVVPIDACGGSGILAFGKKVGYKPLIIGVEENETVLDDTPDKLGLNVLKVANYWEALGVIAAHKSGIDPKSLRRDGVKHIQFSSSMLQQNFIPDSGLQNSTVLH
ncbi:uncharacterized protein LOC131070753 isoform X4 [Cryptomeria japonica]|uniref:uncharacterized protein LOC131070753 isoform X4 n=1 Tax=Cryptomeria japonica TaxID=3369 RepID=UPI0025AD3BEE|nr:uncharacterized protein LOC131070753 isoform X4 [Cryptomeria japonica]